MLMIFSVISLFGATANAAFSVPGFELVVTDPVETKLQNEDLRNPTEVWLELIDGAKKRLDFGQMYASGKVGEPLDQVLERLEAAGDRGVKIRFLVEEKMMRASVPETLERLKKIKNLELRSLEFGKISEGGIIHAKFIVVDGGERAFVGSQNFDWRALKHIHETGLLVTDKKIARQVQSIFDHDWKAWATLKKGQKVKPTGHVSAKVSAKERAYLVSSPKAYNPKGVIDAEAELARLLGEAKTEVRIQLLDYYPLNRDKTFYPVIDNAIRAALSRKVKIKLMVSHWNTSKPGIDHLKSLALLPGMEIRVVTIPESKEGFIPFARVSHSKFMEIDQQTVWVGTSNWTGGYLDKTRSLELVVKDEKLARRLGELHEQMWSSAYSEPLNIQKDYPKPNKGGE